MSMFEDMTKTELDAILTGIFTASLIVSNIIAAKHSISSHLHCRAML
ncbi:hypothetical protein [Methanobrevibacter sp.]